MRNGWSELKGGRGGLGARRAATARRALRAGPAHPRIRRSHLSSGAGGLLLVLALALAGPPVARPATRSAPVPQVAEQTVPPGSALGQLPVSFEENRGQTDAEVRYLARMAGQTVFFTGSEAVFAVSRRGQLPSESLDAPGREGLVLPPETLVLRMAFEGASGEASIEGEDPLPGRSNYFTGSDPATWAVDIPQYGRIRYRELYPGVDLIFYEGPQHQLEYDFVVSPGADPAVIALRFDGADRVYLDEDGNLALDTAFGPLVQSRPTIYQAVAGSRSAVEGGWEVAGSAAARFSLGGYDGGLPLIIDPVLPSYASYLGGGGDDWVNGVAVDSWGSAYLTGRTASVDYPVVSGYQPSLGGSQDAFVTKLSASGGSIAYSSYLGGSGSDEGRGIAVDFGGNAYVAGTTASADFPTAGSPFQGSSGGGGDGFVTKVSSAGTALTYSSYLGGGGADYAFDIDVNSLDNAFVAGYTYSANFPTAAPFQGSNAGNSDAFVTRVNAAGSSLLYSSYLGGTSWDFANELAVDSSNNAYVVGTTSSTDFPTTAPLQAANAGADDFFVTKVNAAGSAKVYSTYLGGSDFETGYGIAVDGSGNAYVAGATYSSDYPTVSPFQGAHAGGVVDGVVSKINSAGSGLTYSSYLGGGGDDYVFALAVDAAGSAYGAGSTSSSNFPLTSAFQAAYGGPTTDAFVTKLNPAGSSKLYSSYFGAGGTDAANSVAVDGSNNAYIAGFTSSTALQTTSAFQPAYAGGVADGFVAKITSGYPRRANTNSASVQSAGPAQRAAIANGGTHIAFHSPAGDLVSGDSNGAGDVFVKVAATGVTERVSTNTSMIEGNAGSRFPAITPDGRYVAFMSDATNLYPGDTNAAEDIYLKDRASGFTERISIKTDGSEGASGKASRFPAISADGQFVAFQTQAALEGGDTNGRWDVYVRDRLASTTTRVSLTDGELGGNGSSVRPSISDDGTRVTFHSWATNLVGGDSNGKADVFVRDSVAGTTTRASVATGGAQGNDESLFPKISGNGSVVAFHSVASNLVAGDGNGTRDTFVRVLGAATTTRVSVATGGSEANGQSGYGSISANGRYVAFHSVATNLVGGDGNGQQDVFVRDRVDAITERVSVTTGSGEPNGTCGSVAISPDGGHLGYHSTATNIVSTDSNGQQDVFYTARP